ncbi:transglutaminase-like cysteine peptidase [Pseudoalteromonas shioyasakiensis]|uniref:transglutaminase-like cysteine peptidase n=1 Tax=Pseudoalteromonas shioyasakiensis TaxID=1190813 RepID=UPI002118B303|nr:transglutaminase-like cysteine peptidase [Pseudoalteromonas shioyasakiensis]MCQ8876504.1 transglutaminase-like cysteine peptidase [Pseudoalteromonas shioyasakiensis]
MRYKFLLFLLIATTAKTENSILHLHDTKVLSDATKHYDSQGATRIKRWLDFLKSNSSESDWRKIHLVNNFMNKHIQYKDDIKHWGKNDYWATPLETLGMGAGDCEDYVIAKYFTLLSLGISEDKIRFMYVRKINVNQPHMVLIYFEQPNQIPFVLDNFTSKVTTADQRNDLTPIYSFNGSGLWLAKAKGLGNQLRTSPGVSSWAAMIERIEKGQVRPTP